MTEPSRWLPRWALALSLAIPASGGATATPGRNWNAVVALTPAGTHLLGNPQAKLRLTEFISYTCPHCARFEQEAEAPLRLRFIASGEGAVEVRHFVRDPVDVTVALLTNCGSPAKFFANHTMFLRNQRKWIGRIAAASPTQKARWLGGAFTTRTRAIARDFGFYEMMTGRGYGRPQLDACLANQALAERLAAATKAAQEELGVQGTPTFAINGVVLAGTSDWASLQPQLAARM